MGASPYLVANGSSPILVTPPVGFFAGTVIAAISSGTGGLEGSANNRVNVNAGFVLPFATSVSKITFVVSASVAAHNYSVGLYDANGNRVVFSGILSTSVTGVRTITITPVLLPAGFYFFACTTDTIGSITWIALSYQDGSGNVGSVKNATIRRGGFAANNVGVGGALPLTLGGLSATVINSAMPVIWFEP